MTDTARTPRPSLNIGDRVVITWGERKDQPAEIFEREGIGYVVRLVYSDITVWYHADHVRKIDA